jgi:hypothetical protein
MLIPFLAGSAANRCSVKHMRLKYARALHGRVSIGQLVKSFNIERHMATFRHD